MAVSAIGRTCVDDARAVAALTNAVASSNDDIRRRAVQALGEYGMKGSNVLSFLQLAMTDSDVYVRWAATNSAIQTQENLQSLGINQ